jgi:Fe2+ transport system protein FeoA
MEAIKNMEKSGIPLAHLKKGKTGRIIEIHSRHHGGHHGGNHGMHGFQRRLNILGIRVGQIVRVDSKQPLMGPITVSVGNSQMTMGRGMAHKIIVEEL